MNDTAGAIRGGMPVLGSDGHPLGVVDHLDGTFIKLMRSDDASGGRHRWIARALVGALHDGQVHLAVTATEADAAALDEDEAQRRMIFDANGRREFGQPDDGGAPARPGQPAVVTAAPEPHPGRPLP
ncbi:DUF2171 domain-containing protein [Dankookia sp. GCM10030260]|uniref:DUF2171 domain-containing protein n=1 Tax=Dankookia sp. GCM10030260 TaxID=3273390 RepID=UPI003609AFA9